MLQFSIIAGFLAIMLAPWAYAARRISGVKVAAWMVAFAAIMLGTVMQLTFGANATYYTGYYGAIVFGIGLMAAAAAYFNRR